MIYFSAITWQHQSGAAATAAATMAAAAAAAPAAAAAAATNNNQHQPTTSIYTNKCGNFLKPNTGKLHNCCGACHGTYGPAITPCVWAE